MGSDDQVLGMPKGWVALAFKGLGMLSLSIACFWVGRKLQDG